MKNLMIMASMAFACFSCRMFQNVTKSKEESKSSVNASNSLKLVSEHKRDLTANMLTFRKDSGNRKYTVQVWPLGNFTYSPERGFEGQAERIQISGQERSVSSSSELHQSHELSNKNIRANQRQDFKVEHKSAKATTASSASWKWIIAAGSIVVMMIIYLLWRFRLRFI